MLPVCPALNGSFVVVLVRGGPWAGLGNDHFTHVGLLAQIICGHYGSIPNVSQLAIDNKIECYNLPRGTIAAIMRTTITDMPGELTKVGLNTYIDPRPEGGRFNRCTTKDIVKVAWAVRACRGKVIA